MIPSLESAGHRHFFHRITDENTANYTQKSEIISENETRAGLCNVTEEATGMVRRCGCRKHDRIEQNVK